MTDHDLIGRLAAANPVPTGAYVHGRKQVRRPCRLLAALVLAGAVVVPAAAFADQISNLFGLSNQGTSVPASSLALSQDSGLAAAMHQLEFPSSLQNLGTRDGITFYAAQRTDGRYCLAVESISGRGVGCALGKDPFPSPQHPVLIFPGSRYFAGFAADDVASVSLLDAAGATVATTMARGNLFADGPLPDSAVSVEALDVNGDLLATQPVLRPVDVADRD
jgi:hypothetical protein